MSLFLISHFKFKRSIQCENIERYGSFFLLVLDFFA